VLLGHLVLVGGTYLCVLRIAEWRAVSLWDSTGAVDRWTPALPWAIAIYFTLYLYFPLTVLLAPRGPRGVEALLFHLQAQVLLTALTSLFFLALPTKIHLRQEMEQAMLTSGALVRGLYEQLYSLDSPWNAWPSLHVSLSLLMLLTCARFTHMRHGRHGLWRAGAHDSVAVAIAAPCWIVLCWSILATKQHFFFDVWTGAIAGWLTWRLYLRPRIERCDLPDHKA
jgi:membrane-associated phospholipid phosphatase